MPQTISSIPKKPMGVHAPLSLAQRRLWILYQLDPQSSEYNISRAWRLKGSLNTEVLVTSLNHILARHEALRTTFQEIDGQLIQVIQPTLTAPLQERDCSSYSPAQLEAEIDRFLIDEPLQPFDLLTDPLLRFTLMRCKPDDHVLVFTVHHMVFDGMSLKNFCEELSRCYAATLAGQPDPLAPLPIQYQDFSYWQQANVTDEMLASQLSFWKQQLQGAPLVLELPSDFPRPKENTGQEGFQVFTLTHQVISKLKQLIQPQGITVFMALLAVFQILLARYTGQRDILVGTPIAGRTHTDLEDLIGFLVNTLVLRTQILGQPSFQEVLRQVRKTCLEAYRHQDLPFEKLVEVLKPVRDPSRYPIVQAIFQLRQLSDICLTFPEIVAHPFPVKKRTGNFDLHMVCEETESGIQGFLYYSEDLFSGTQMARFAEHYQRLLEVLLANPQRPVCQVPFLTEAECHQQLVKWNNTATAYPRDICIHDLFEAQVEQTPDAIALVFGEQQLTYGELNVRANQLAHYLHSHGVEPEARVGLCVERSLEMVVGILGILKAGGAYAPLDPSTPPDRMAFMLQDADIALVLTQDALKARLPVEWAGPVIAVDTEWATIAQTPATNLTNGVTAENLAYIMYTSGSTGVPKGTSICQRNVMRLVMNTNYFEVGPADTFLLFAPSAFDASTFELWASLLHGAKLVIFPPHKPSLEELGRCLQEYEISTLWLTAVLFHQMVDNQPEALRGVRQLLAGGDVLSVPHVQGVVANLPEGGRLINGYGPTENTTFTCCHVMTSESRVETSVPIGRPIANTQVYVLDRAMQPVPVGVYGELYIGGDGLARNYLKRPALTAEKFVPHPLSEEPGARLYRTGDEVRYLADGTLEFKGRHDHQVKVRGYRIELGEIEAALCQHSDVQEAVVVVREDPPGEKRLVGYVVSPQETVSTSELRQHLKQSLPEYMVPAHFVMLDALPMTPNGKVDRRSLPEPDGGLTERIENFVPPRNPMEANLAKIWANLLRVEQVGIQDDFFELGGHSLVATQVIARVRDGLGVEVPLRALFEGPTVAELAQRVAMLRQIERGLEAPPLVCIPRGQPLELSFAQQRLWFLDQLEPDSVAYSMPRSIRLKGVLRKEALQKTYVELARRHETLRTTFHSTEGNPVLRIAAQPNVLFDTVDLRHLPDVEREAEAKRLSEEDARKPFDLTRGPLFRIRLFQLEDEEHVLHFNMHHIISDGWSFGVMDREIAAFYTAFIEGKSADLPELPIQYADYAAWQRQWLQGEALKAQLSYWKDKLCGELALLELPTDRPRPAVQTHRGAMESLALSKVLSDALQAMSRREGVTLFMTLLAAFKTLLYRLTGQADTIVGTPIAGRNRTELEELIGFFMNTIVMRTDLSGQPSFRELLGRVRETALGAYAHQDLPFEKLVEELSPERDLSRAPLFQVFFNHIVTRGDKAAQLPGLEAEAVGGREDRESKFDMTLYVLEGEGGIKLRLVYNTDLYDSWRMVAMLKQYQMLLVSIVSDSDQCISELSLLTEAERHQILVDWNDTQQDYSSEKTLVHLFEEQVERSPDAIAVVYEDQTLTYKALNKQANQLAHYLSSLGVGPETHVGLSVERSFEMVVGILGILKAGGAYVPLDPKYPHGRLAFMLGDAQISVLLTMRAKLEDFPEYTGDAVCLDKDWLDITSVSDGNLNKRIKPDDPACVIYTSGSTGNPKGVLIAHSSICNHMLWRQQTYPLRREDRFLHKASLSFDISVWEIFAPLLAGARLILARPGGQMDGAYLAELVIDKKVTVIHFSPTALQQFLEEKAIETCSSLKRVFCGGEVMSADLKRKFFTCLNAELIHQYGPTETTVDVTTWECKPEDDHIVVPIGHPIANTQLYILDANLQPVPVGVQGELYIGGASLARGYLNRPELTAEKFIADPFSYEADSRIYKTGDLGRYRNDGSIEFLGRKDFQVKLRGFRIELGEVEATLCLHPSVSEAVVVAREDRPGDKRLVAYVVAAAAESASSIGLLRAFLQEKLPDYMIPSAFVFLDVLPLTANGKVDRRALPEPELGRSRLETKFVAPRGPLEEGLVKIWKEVLSVEPVGIHDNFFALGGHSLLATKVVSRIRAYYQVPLPLVKLFECPTIEGLAEEVENLLIQQLQDMSDEDAEQYL